MSGEAGNDEVQAGEAGEPAPTVDESIEAGPAPGPLTGEIAATGAPAPEVPATPTAEVPATPMAEPLAGGAGDHWGHGPVPPYGTPRYPYGAPQHPYASPYTYGPPQHPYAPPTGSKHVGPIPVVAVVAALIVAAAVGAGVEYALNHNTNTSQSGGVIPAPSSGGSSAGSGTTPSGVNVSAIAAKVDPAVVDINTTLAQGGAAAGTGIVLTSSGLVLTNNHVIENATTVNAQIGGTGRTYTATVLGYSITSDVALLQLKNASGLTAATTASSSNLSVGQSIVAIGNALGTGGTPTAVAGTITALDQTITAGSPGTASETLHGLIQIDAAIQSGDSGGPLVDTSARVVGMNTAASVSGNGFGDQSGTGQAYAIGIDDALAIANQIKAGESSATIQIGPRALLGVEVSDVVSTSGAYVERVQAGSPAASAGISAGDAIVSVDGTTISSASDLSDALVNHKPGDSVTVGWADPSGSSHSASVKLTVGPPA